MILRLFVLCLGVSLAAVAGYEVVRLDPLFTPEAPESPPWSITVHITPEPSPSLFRVSPSGD